MKKFLGKALSDIEELLVQCCNSKSLANIKWVYPKCSVHGVGHDILLNISHLSLSEFIKCRPQFRVIHHPEVAFLVIWSLLCFFYKIRVNLLVFLTRVDTLHNNQGRNTLHDICFFSYIPLEANGYALMSVFREQLNCFSGL